MNQGNAFAQFLGAFVALTLSACAHGEKQDAGRVVQSTEGAVVRAPSQVLEDGYPGMAKAMQGRPMVVLKSGSPENNACIAQYEKASRHIPLWHDAIFMDYNGFHRVPNWVFHQITAEGMSSYSYGRYKGNFIRDPILAEAAVDHKDYTGSGFDRGHMVPSGDFSYDAKLNKQTFFASNLSPQSPDMNQKDWERLEDQVRKWACGLGRLKVYTGPIFDEGLIPYRLKSCISVPHRFFKILLAEKRDGKSQAIAFIYGQNTEIAKGQENHWQTKVASIDEVEQATGIDFFAEQYSVQDQAAFEAQKNPADWESAGSAKCDELRAKAKPKQETTVTDSTPDQP
ncbi:MAG: DNA/RNA non-specific endonuclease [Bdellovibrionales bacterium]|nr:DNA/RNA non-specific endonuclease [Bdellovibrionales bacterium]